MAFRLYDAAEGGAQVGSALTPTVPVSDGLFTVPLDFGASAFTGDARWLGIQVQCPGDAGYADLGRQPLTAASYALYALTAPWAGLRGVPAGFADGVDGMAAVVSGTAIFAGDGLTLAASGDSVTVSVSYAGSNGDYGTALTVARSDHRHDGDYALLIHTHAGSDITSAVPTATLALVAADAAMLDGQPGSAYQHRVTGACGAGNAIRVVNADGSVTCEPVGEGGWSLIGNAGTDPNVNFLGTTDDVSLTLAVNGMPALRLSPAITSPNVIGGYGGNVTGPGVAGASIGGGGMSSAVNGVYGNYGAVSGGIGNAAAEKELAMRR